jgi:REP element-mobilizing transposase RayT
VLGRSQIISRGIAYTAAYAGWFEAVVWSRTLALYNRYASCYRRAPLLESCSRRDTFLQVLEDMRQRHEFVVVGYVVMPEHFHLLISEPEKGTPSVVVQALK